jgi:plastocyanin
MRLRWGRNVVAALLLLALTLAGAASGAAQDGTPDTDGGTEGAVAHPAHVHVGSCADLDPNPTFPLADVAPVDSEPEGAESALPVEQSVTELDVALDDLLDEAYAINVHAGVDDLATYIACGDIGGALVELDGDDRQLAIGLAEQNDSGYSGVAVLTEDGADATTVAIYLTGQPAESADGEDAQAEEVTIEIVDFFFDPEDVTVTVGTTVTWVNVGPTDHTTTAYVDGDKFWDSAIMVEGDVFSFTFEEPGSYDYLCALHPSMTAHLEVVE